MESTVGYKKLLASKLKEKQECEQQLGVLKRSKINIQRETKEWMGKRSKHNSQTVTSEVVVAGKFQGNKAEDVKKKYHMRIAHMNSKYMDKIATVCQQLESQITNVENYISDLDKTIDKLKTEIENKGG